MENLTVFNFNTDEVRVIFINEEAWFVISDLLSIIQSSSKLGDVKAKLVDVFGDEGVSNLPILDSLGRNQNTYITPEYGVTYLLANSRTEMGRSMNLWLHKEVLPSIRKTGQYGRNLTPAQMLLAQAKQMVAHEERLAAHEKELILLKLKQEELEQKAIEANEALGVIPRSELPMIKTTDRAALNQLVRSYAVAKGVSYQLVWSKLYQELYYKQSYDARARSKNSGGKLTALDCVVKDNQLSCLFSIASSILV